MGWKRIAELQTRLSTASERERELEAALQAAQKVIDALEVVLSERPMEVAARAVDVLGSALAKGQSSVEGDRTSIPKQSNENSMHCVSTGKNAAVRLDPSREANTIILKFELGRRL